MPSPPSGPIQDGANCTVVAGTFFFNDTATTEIYTSKTGQVTITVVQKDGVRFKTLAKSVVMSAKA